MFRDIYRTLTPLGWLLFLILIIAPFMIGWAWGYSTNSTLIKLQSRTNGMEHTTNFEQLHKADLINIKKRKVDFK